MFKNPLESKENKKQIGKLHKNLRGMALKKAMRTGSKDEDGRTRPDADRNRND